MNSGLVLAQDLAGTAQPCRERMAHPFHHMVCHFPPPASAQS